MSSLMSPPLYGSLKGDLGKAVFDSLGKDGTSADRAVEHARPRSCGRCPALIRSIRSSRHGHERTAVLDAGDWQARRAPGQGTGRWCRGRSAWIRPIWASRFVGDAAAVLAKVVAARPRRPGFASDRRPEAAGLRTILTSGEARVPGSSGVRSARGDVRSRRFARAGTTARTPRAMVLVTAS